MADVNPTGQWKESLSLEETNKVRISLGLKPLKDPNPSAVAGPTDEEREVDGDELAERNFRKRQEQERRDADEKRLFERIEKARNQKERARKLVGKGLGADDDDDTSTGATIKAEDGGIGQRVRRDDEADTKAWVKKQKKRAKELAAKRAKEQEEADRLAEDEERTRAERYGERDLKGIKVAHGAEAFDEGEEHVLTLKDSRILDDEDDELHNLNLTENARHAAAVELKKKGRQAGQYTGYDDEEFGEDGALGTKRGVLSKYDEGFEGAKEEGFKLGSEAPVKKKGTGQNGASTSGGPPETGEREKVKLSMDYTKSFNTDYLQEGDAGFKKPKMKKKKRPTRTTTIAGALEDGDASTSAASSMDVDAPVAKIERADLDSSNLIDDDDLAVSLARQRREAAKSKVKQMKERAKANLVEGMSEVKKEEEDDEESLVRSGDGDRVKDERAEADAEDVLVMDDTSEFVRNIRVAAEEAANRPVRAKVEPKKEEAGEPDLRGLESVRPKIKSEPMDDDDGAVPLSEMDMSGSRPGWNEASRIDEDEQDVLMRNLDERQAEEGEEVEETKPAVSKGGADDDEFGTTSGEKLVSKGLASTLSILRHQGLMKPRTPEELQKEKEFKEREAWLVMQRKRDAERERERIESRNAGDRKDQRQREYENKLRDQRDAQAAMEAYKNYKPVVDIKYHDEFGRDMTPKEAWKHLSHSFHGHGHGSKKTEKRLQKIENERKAAAMAAGDTPNSTAAAFAARAEKTGSATMILGVGNNNSAPMHPSDESLSLSKKQSLSKGKGKATASDTPVFDDIPMRALPLPTSTNGGASASPEPARKGFAPVRSFSPATANGGDSSSSPGPKFAPISVAVKRKASEPVEDGQSHKRRN
ncbi:hypothetical protein JCM10212_003029 [Sporobolomyces blumeae]